MLTLQKHHHGRMGQPSVHKLYAYNIDKNRRTSGGHRKYIPVGTWCPVCGFEQNSILTDKQLQILGV